MFRKGDPCIDCVPEVEKSWCCFKASLRFGSVIIALITLFVGGIVFLPKKFIPCEGGGLIKIAGFIFFPLLGASAFLTLASFVFLIGICWDKELTARIWLYCAYAFLVLYILYYVLLIIGGFLGGCKWFIDLGIFIVIVLVFIYFIVVVKSYASQDMDD